jgi:hypothetical protein
MQYEEDAVVCVDDDQVFEIRSTQRRIRVMDDEIRESRSAYVCALRRRAHVRTHVRLTARILSPEVNTSSVLATL